MKSWDEPHKRYMTDERERTEEPQNTDFVIFKKCKLSDYKYKLSDYPLKKYIL